MLKNDYTDAKGALLPLICTFIGCIFILLAIVLGRNVLAVSYVPCLILMGFVHWDCYKTFKRKIKTNSVYHKYKYLSTILAFNDLMLGYTILYLKKDKILSMIMISENMLQSVDIGNDLTYKFKNKNDLLATLEKLGKEGLFSNKLLRDAELDKLYNLSG
jgi:hypothetical protein